MLTPTVVRALVMLGLVLAISSVALPTCSFAASNLADDPPAVMATRVGVHGTVTRLVVELSRSVPYTISREGSRTGSPDDVTSGQILLNLPGVVWRGRTGRLAGSGRIRGYRFEPGTTGSSRLVVETAGPTRVRSVVEIPPSEGHALRLILDLDRDRDQNQDESTPEPPSRDPRPAALTELTTPVANVIATRVASHPDRTRFVLEVSEAVRFQAETSPDRVLIHLPRLNPRGTPEPRPGEGLVQRYRIEADGSGGGSLAVLETTGPVRLKTAFLIPPSEGHKTRLVVDMVPAGPIGGTGTGDARFTKPPPAPAAPRGSRSASLAASPAGLPTDRPAPAPAMPALPPPALSPRSAARDEDALELLATRIGTHPGTTRFVLEASAPLQFRTEIATAPYRLEVFLPGLKPSGLPGLKPAGNGVARPGQGLIRTYRIEPDEGNGARVILETTGPVRLKTASLLPPSEGHQTRLVLDLTATDSASFAALSPALSPDDNQSPQPLPAPAPPARLAASAAPPAPPETPVPKTPPPAPPAPATSLPPEPSVPATSLETETVPEVITTRIGAHPGMTRFVLELSAPVRFEVDAEGTPGQVLVRLPRLNRPTTAGPDAAGPVPVSGHGLIRRYRIDPDDSDGGSLAVLETSGPVRLKAAFLIPPSEGYKTRLVVDLTAAPPAATAATVSIPATAATVSIPATAATVSIPAPAATASAVSQPPPTRPASRPAAGPTTGDVLADLPRTGPLPTGRTDAQLAMLPATPAAQRRRPGTPATTVTVPISSVPATPSAPDQSLEDALVQAYASNPTLNSARATLRSVEEGVPQARALARPQTAITGTTGPTWSRSGASGADASATTGTGQWIRTNPKTVGLSVSQPIYKGGQIDASISQAENALQAQQATLLDTEQTILLQAATAYLNLAQDQALVTLYTDFEGFQKRDLKALEDRFHAGEVNQTDVSLQEAQLASASASRASAEGALRSDRATYLKLIGSPPLKLALPKLGYPLPATLDEAIALAEGQNPRIINARFTESAAQDTVDVADSALLPSLSLVANLDRSVGSGAVNAFGNTASVVANLSIPLDNGSNAARSRAARESASAARTNIEQNVRAAREAATTAWEQLMTSRSNITFYEAATRSSELAAKGIRQQIAIGTSTIIDLLNTEQALLSTRISLLRARHDEAVSVFSLLAAIGQLSASTLALPVSDTPRSRTVDR